MLAAVTETRAVLWKAVPLTCEVWLNFGQPVLEVIASSSAKTLSGIIFDVLQEQQRGPGGWSEWGKSDTYEF